MLHLEQCYMEYTKTEHLWKTESKNLLLELVLFLEIT